MPLTIRPGTARRQQLAGAVRERGGVRFPPPPIRLRVRSYVSENWANSCLVVMFQILLPLRGDS